MTLIPAVTIEALLTGLQASGVDTDKIRNLTGLAARYTDPLELLENSVWGAIWQVAFELDPRPELPTHAAMSIPFGLFGQLDYLAGSAQTVRGGLRSLSDHFSAASTATELELDFNTSDVATLRVMNLLIRPNEIINDEFTIAVILGRFHYVSNGRFRPQRVYLTRPQLLNAAHEEVFQAPVVYGATRAGFDFDSKMLDIEQSLSNVRLHDTLLEIAKKLGFGNEDKVSFELAVRARLRSLIPKGQAVAEKVARSLGVSERTLHRRLAESGSSFRDVLDQFRIEESERFLLQGKMTLVEIALALGFADQATWSRAFRRLRGSSPTSWRSENGRVD